jgi:hypothetical protein
MYNCTYNLTCAFLCTSCAVEIHCYSQEELFENAIHNLCWGVAMFSTLLQNELVTCVSVNVGRGSVVSIATSYGLDGPGIDSR